MRISRPGFKGSLLAVLFTFFSVSADSSTPECLVSFDSARLNVCDGQISLANDNISHLADEQAFADSRIRIVKFDGPITTGQRSALVELGVEIIGYAPYYGFKVRMEAGLDDAVRRIPGVNWTGPYLPIWKVGINLANELQDGRILDQAEHLNALRVSLHPGITVTQARVAFEAVPGLNFRFSGKDWDHEFMVLHFERTRLASIVEELAANEAVNVVNFHWPAEFTNSRGVGLHQGGRASPPAVPVFDQGLYGCGQVIGILDSGLHTPHCSFEDASGVDFPFENCAGGENCTSIPATETHRKIAAYYKWSGVAGGPADDQVSGHGTFVAGNALGSNFANPVDCENPASPGNMEDVDGMAPGARMVMQEAGGGLEYLNSQGGSLYHAATTAYENGARIHNNSWGSGCRGLFASCMPGCLVEYRPASRGGDAAAWENPDLLIFAAAGNSGGGDGGPGCGPGADVGAPGNAKSVFGIGGNVRGTQGDNMYTSSSRGPASDRRTKPDVLAQSTGLFSSTKTACGTDDWAGTSFGSPTAAGLGALVREYLQRGFYPLGVEEPTFAIPDPSGALIRAIMTNGSVEMTGTGVSGAYPDQNQGWGRVLLDNSLYFEGDDRRLWLHDGTDGLEAGDMDVHSVVAEAGQPLIFTLVWHDFPAELNANPHIVNMLRLEVEDPDGEVWTQKLTPGGGLTDPNPFQATTLDDYDDLNTVHQIMFDSPATGVYEVRVRGIQVAMGDAQPYALAATGTWLRPAESDFLLQLEPTSIAVCQGQDAVYDIGVFGVLDFDDPVTLSIDDVPAGATVSFSANPVTPADPGDVSVLTIANTTAAAPGEYALAFEGESSGPNYNPTVHGRNLNLRVDEGLSAPGLLVPANSATGIDRQPDFSWDALAGATEYRLQVATDSGFDTIIIEEIVPGAGFTPADELASGTDFFWRVRASNACGESDWSAVFEFQTRFEPVADISPDSFSFDVQTGDTASDTLFIDNPGTGELSWAIGTDEIDGDCTNPADVPWLGATPDSGNTLPGSPSGPQITVDAALLAHGQHEANLCVTTNATTGPQLAVIPVFVNADDPTFASLQGNVNSLGVCDMDGTLSDALVSVQGQNNLFEASTDANGFYSFEISETESPVTITVSASLHAGEVRGDVALAAGQLNVEDFDLDDDAACIALAPEELSQTLEMEQTADRTIDISNFGTQALDWTVIEPARHYSPGAVARVNNADEGGDAARWDRSDPLIGFNFTTPESATPDPRSWTRISEIEGMIEDVTDDTGSTTGINVEWGGVTTYGFAYLDNDTLAPDAVPEYDYDLSGMTGFATRIDGHFFIELSGLEPDTLYEFWFVAYGGSVDIGNLVNVSNGDDPYALQFLQEIGLFDNDGRFVINETVGRDTQNFNELSMSTRSSSSGTIRFDWTAPKAIAEIARIGALAIRQTVDCAMPEWLSVPPTSGSIPVGGGLDEITATFDAANLDPGIYEGAFCIESNDPVWPIVPVPVSLQVELPADYATIEGKVKSAGYCDDHPVPLEGATVEVVGDNSAMVTLSTDENGFYQAFLPDSESPIDILVTHPDQHDGNAAGVSFDGGDTVIEDFALMLDAPCATVDPGSLTFDLQRGEDASDVLTIGNFEGGADLEWSTGEAGQNVAPSMSASASTVDPRAPEDGTPVDNSASDAGIELASMLGEPLPGAAMANPNRGGLFDCDSEPGIIINDDGTVENGYAGSTSIVNNHYAIFVDRYTPGTYPATFSGVCIGFITLDGPTTYDVEIVAFADDGPGGEPGTELGSVSATVTVDPLNTPPPDHPVVWNTIDISSMRLLIESGDVYIGARWALTSDNVAIAVDQTASNPPGFSRGMYLFAHNNVWSPIESGFPSYRSLMVRPVERAPGCLVPEDIPWLSVDSGSGLTPAGGSSDVNVTVNTADLAQGSYEASVCVHTDDPDASLISVPITLLVTDPAAGTLEGEVTSAGYCGQDSQPLAGALVTIMGENDTFEVMTDGDGLYNLPINEGNSPVDIAVSADNHLNGSASGVVIVPEQTATEDFELVLDSPCATVEPEIVEVELGQDDATSRALVLGNEAGSTDLEWTIHAAESAGMPVSPPAAVAGPVVDSAASGAGVNLASVLGEPLPRLAMANPGRDGLFDCDSQPGITINDDGTVEAGYSGSPDAGVYEVIFVDRYTPSVYPATFSGVCIGFITVEGPTTYDVEIVAYADDGPVGDPGTELGSMNATVTVDPLSTPIPPEHPVFWNTIDISPMNLLIESGDVYIGVRWTPLLDNVYIAADQSDSNPPGFSGGRHQFDSDNLWRSIGSGYPDYRSLMIRAVEGAAGCLSPEDIPWLSVDSDTGTVPAGGSSEVQVTFNAAGLALGEYQALLCISSNDPGNSILSVPVSMSVLDQGPGELDVTPEVMDFGSLPIGQSATRGLTVSNTAQEGAMVLVLSQLVVTEGDHAFEIIGGDCAEGTMLAPQQSCILEVRFTPVTEATYTGIVMVVSEGAQSAEVVLSGTGVDTEPGGDDIFHDSFEVDDQD